MKLLKTGLAALAAILIVCPSAGALVTDRIVAVVNDEVITLAELNQAFEPYADNIEANYKGNDKESVLQQNKQALLLRMVDQMLIEQEAKKAGAGLAAVKDEEVMEVMHDMLAKNNLTLDAYTKKLKAEGSSLETVKKEIRSQLLRMRLLRREVQSKILITDEAIGKYYTDHRQDYEGKEAVHIKQIFLPVAAGADKKIHDEAGTLALQLRKRIAAGEPFEMLAAQYSKDAAAAQGGDIGFVEKGVILPQVEKAAFSLSEGQVSDVIESELGFHIIAVVDKRGAGLKPLPDVRNEIKAKIQEEMIAQKYEEWINDIRKKSFIDIRLQEAATGDMDFIRIKGAAQHNLKNVHLDIPRDRLVVITGVSGSGKSSLAFDTIYAEGQRRYVESLSTYARQFIGQMDKPEVESIEGLSPAIAIEQRAASHNPRSTVGTVTEIYDYFRLLFAGVGLCHCYNCGREIHSQTIDSIVQAVLDMPEGSRFSVLAPIVRGKKGEFTKELKKLQKEGFARVRIDGEIRDLAEEMILTKTKRHDIDLIVDRLVRKEGIRLRLRDSLEIAAGKSDGLVRIVTSGGDETLYSEKYACPDCGISMPTLAPRVFSFNSPYGACPQCNGLGSRMHFALDLVVPDAGLSLREGAIAPWAGRNSLYYFNLLDALSTHYKFDLNMPFNKLPEKIQNVLLYGSGDETIKFYSDRPDKRYFAHRPFEGAINQLERRWRETASTAVRNDLARFIDLRPCESCGGARLKKESLAVTVGGKNIYELCLLSIRECFEFFQTLRLTPQETLISERILKEVKSRLSFLLNVGLDYLNLARSTSTLSGGESQRIRLATQIGSGLMGVLYVLDEPTVGLHQKDNLRLIDTLKKLRDLGNTVLVVEHDADMMLACDHIVDMGPGAGAQGGEVIFQGGPDIILQSETSLTGKFLSGRESIAFPAKRRSTKGRHIILEGASQNNLKNIDIKIPTGVLTAVTGVSGSGKSTMVIETLYKVLARRLNLHSGGMGKIRRVKDMGDIERVIMINQQPIGRTPRSNPVTYTGIFSFIRDLFTGLPEARIRGYKPGRFSFNVKGGRCEACEGNGLIKIEMHFLPDVYVTCDACRGKRFNADTLDIKYKDKSIAEVLDLTVRQALDFFANIPSIRSHLQLLDDVGLGYIRLGQSATTLSGGEAQRIKLARELGKRVNSNTLYILDEPTIGLHFADIQRLLDVLMRLVDMGNTMVVIEHNLDIIKSADHVIDLGPEGGPGGGQIIASGTVEEVARNEHSSTGQFLKKIIDEQKDRALAQTTSVPNAET